MKDTNKFYASIYEKEKGKDPYSSDGERWFYSYDYVRWLEDNLESRDWLLRELQTQIQMCISDLTKDHSDTSLYRIFKGMDLAISKKLPRYKKIEGE